ncbi:hypothetical protein FRC09_018055, partial [Ceratobasidium sp. 395]
NNDCWSTIPDWRSCRRFRTIFITPASKKGKTSTLSCVRVLSVPSILRRYLVPRM